MVDNRACADVEFLVVGNEGHASHARLRVQSDGNDEGSPETQQERDLMALYVVADRYLVDKAKTLVRRELVRRFNDDQTNVMPVFDLALAVAPELCVSAPCAGCTSKATRVSRRRWRVVGLGGITLRGAEGGQRRGQ